MLSESFKDTDIMFKSNMLIVYSTICLFEDYASRHKVDYLKLSVSIDTNQETSHGGSVSLKLEFLM